MFHSLIHSLIHQAAFRDDYVAGIEGIFFFFKVKSGKYMVPSCKKLILLWGDRQESKT